MFQDLNDRDINMYYGQTWVSHNGEPAYVRVVEDGVISFERLGGDVLQEELVSSEWSPIGDVWGFVNTRRGDDVVAERVCFGGQSTYKKGLSFDRVRGISPSELFSAKYADVPTAVEAIRKGEAISVAISKDYCLEYLRSIETILLSSVFGTVGYVCKDKMYLLIGEEVSFDETLSKLGEKTTVTEAA